MKVEVHYHSPMGEAAMHRFLWLSNVGYLLRFASTHGGVSQHNLRWLEPQIVQANKATSIPISSFDHFSHIEHLGNNIG